VPDENSATVGIEVRLVERERFADPQIARQSITITPRSRRPSGSSLAARITATISSAVGGSGG
jgi:hypothetical protein